MSELLEVLRAREAELLSARADASAARELASIAQEQMNVLREHNKRLESENAELKRRLDAYCHRLYGKRAEQVDPAQLALAFAELAKEDAAAVAAARAEAEAAPEADTGEANATEAKPPPLPGHGRGRITSSNSIGSEDKSRRMHNGQCRKVSRQRLKLCT